MTYRYSNFMYDQSGSLFAVIKAVFISPAKLLFECVDQEKLSFIVLTLIPLGIPLLFTRKYERFLLLIPYVLMNLMSDYQYQHDIFFQYTFGATAFLFYLTVLNLADIKLELVRFAAFASTPPVASFSIITYYSIACMTSQIHAPRLLRPGEIGAIMSTALPTIQKGVFPCA